MKAVKIKTRDFDLEATLDSGQVFGFVKTTSGYEGQIERKALRLSQRNGDLAVYFKDSKVSKQEITRYFDLGRDLEPLYDVLKNDSCLAPTLALKGLRLIRQDSWEALACFIISSNNNVKRIQGIWKNLSLYFNGFPTASQIVRSHERILRQLGLGYRAPFLMHTAQFLFVNPGYLKLIREADYEQAKARVLAFPGIGEKVADCALLYGFQKYEAFPVDVWILRVMRKLYFNNRKVPEKKVLQFAQKRWGQEAGYVQQYLFHAARSGVL